MKSVARVWAFAAIVGVFSISYLNASINALAVQPVTNHNMSVVTQNIQGSSPALQPTVKDWQLQDADETFQVQPQTGGNGQDQELQPALGYGALNTVIQ